MPQRYKWTNTGATLIRATARDGATLHQLDQPRPTRARHIHVHLPATRTADQAPPAGGLPAARRDQNVEPEEAGFRDRGIRLTGRDQEGKNWEATIYGPGGAGYEMHDPDALTTSDANAGGPGETDPGKVFEQCMAKILAPSHDADQRNPASLRGLQRLMDQHYRRRS
jgi:hypothetical protein